MTTNRTTEAPHTFTPQLELETLFVLNEQGRIVSTREPNPSRGPRFILIQGIRSCAWAARADVPDGIANRLDRLARDERPTRDFEAEPSHRGEYMSVVGGRVDSGPAFTFPDEIRSAGDVVAIHDVAQLTRYLRGWERDEIPERSPILAVTENGHAVSVCFCARRSSHCAEAGLETAPPFRARGLGTRVTAAWALAIRASGRLPLYSTSWSNAPSIAVARKLNLQPCAGHWSLSD